MDALKGIFLCTLKVTSFYMRTKHRRSTSEGPKRAEHARRVVIDFPEPLLLKAEHAADELNTNRSQLIRAAVSEFLARRERQKLNFELAEGYAANAASALSGANAMMEAERDFS